METHRFDQKNARKSGKWEKVKDNCWKTVEKMKKEKGRGKRVKRVNIDERMGKMGAVEDKGGKGRTRENTHSKNDKLMSKISKQTTKKTWQKTTI